MGLPNLKHRSIKKSNMWSCLKSNKAIVSFKNKLDSTAIDTSAHGINYNDINQLQLYISNVDAASDETISLFKKNLFSAGWIRLPSEQMIAALKFFGATTKDLCYVADPTTSPHSQLYFHEPLLPWKKTQASRFILRKSSENSGFQCHDSKASVKYEVSKREVDFGDYWKDANNDVRSWNVLNEEYGSEKNSVFMAYQKLSHFLIDPSMEPSPGCNGGGDIYVSDHFCIRITKTPTDGDMAQPSPEGVHQDGSDIIMITLMSRRNVHEMSGQTRIWNSSQPSGPYPENSYDNIKKKCIADYVMREPYETTIAIDSKIKHEARPIKPIMHELDCIRDVTVHWTRTPRSSGCDTIGKESEAKEWLREFSLK